MSYLAMTPDELAAVVTYLQMFAPPADPVPASDLSLRRIRPTADEYRSLFRRVGAQWLWFSRLAWPDERLSMVITDPHVEIFDVADPAGMSIGMVELDLREGGECAIAFLGLVPERTGQGHGSWLLAETLRLAWRDGIRRVHVHTCTLDHPAALPMYRKAGFNDYGREIERFPDPRLVGLLPIDCAPQVPVLGTPARVAPPES